MKYHYYLGRASTDATREPHACYSRRMREPGISRCGWGDCSMWARVWIDRNFYEVLYDEYRNYYLGIQIFSSHCICFPSSSISFLSILLTRKKKKGNRGWSFLLFIAYDFSEDCALPQYENKKGLTVAERLFFSFFEIHEKVMSKTDIYKKHKVVYTTNTLYKKEENGYG